MICSVRELLLTVNKVFVKDRTTQLRSFPPPSNPFFQLNKGHYPGTLELTRFLFTSPGITITVFRAPGLTEKYDIRILSWTLSRVNGGKTHSHQGLKSHTFKLSECGMLSVLLWCVE